MRIIFSDVHLNGEFVGLHAFAANLGNSTTLSRAKDPSREIHTLASESIWMYCMKENSTRMGMVKHLGRMFQFKDNVV